MIKEQDIEIDGHKFVISKLPAWQGLMIMSRLPSSIIPKVGDFDIYKDVIAEIFTYVGKRTDNGQVLRFLTSDVFNNHVDDWEIGFKLLRQMMEYNISFLNDGRLSSFLDGITENLPGLIAKTLTLLSSDSSAKS